MTVKIGSLFAGIGGFELGLERSWVNAETIWQVERDTFCQSILSKHWPESMIYNDVKDITKDKVKPVDVLIGGFPCQDISTAGKQKGVHNGEKSSLWWEMWRIVGDLRPRIIIMENVANIIRLGGADVVGSLAQIGYDCEWTVIRASDFGAPHKRGRWFGVAWDSRTIQNSRRFTSNTDGNGNRSPTPIFSRWSPAVIHDAQRFTDSQSIRGDIYRGPTKESQKEKKTRIHPGLIGEQYIGEGPKRSNPTTHTHGQRFKKQSLHTQSMESGQLHECAVSPSFWSNNGPGYWKTTPYPSPFCRVDDGIPNRVARLRALGNAIVPQCSQWVGDQILASGLLDDLLEDK
jgi:DNA (cytosine-5)-methyltransferase 1